MRVTDCAVFIRIARTRGPGGRSQFGRGYCRCRLTDHTAGAQELTHCFELGPTLNWTEARDESCAEVPAVAVLAAVVPIREPSRAEPVRCQFPVLRTCRQFCSVLLKIEFAVTFTVRSGERRQRNRQVNGESYESSPEL